MEGEKGRGKSEEEGREGRRKEEKEGGGGEGGRRRREKGMEEEEGGEGGCNITKGGHVNTTLPASMLQYEQVLIASQKKIL